MFVKCKMRSFFGTFPHSKHIVLKFWYPSAYDALTIVSCLSTPMYMTWSLFTIVIRYCAREVQRMQIQQPVPE